MFASMLERAKNLGVRLTEDELVAHGGTMLLAGEFCLWWATLHGHAQFTDLSTVKVPGRRVQL